MFLFWNPYFCLLISHYLGSIYNKAKMFESGKRVTFFTKIEESDTNFYICRGIFIGILMTKVH